jgi:hypothetical protein
MNPKQRLTATLRGEPVDRPAVSFYEINGLDENPADPDPFNVYNHPSWLPVIALAREHTDRIVMRPVPFPDAPDPLAGLAVSSRWLDENGSRFERIILRAAAGHTLTALTRRDPGLNTTWQVEHLLKNEADLRAFLDLPWLDPCGQPDPTGVLAAEAALGDSGIVMIDTPDPLCEAAALFHMQDYTVLATSEPALFHRLLDRYAAGLEYRTQAVARALPGRLWRIYGPEYASPPYLHPRLFDAYVVARDTPMVRAIQSTGGYARLHCHGNLSRILPAIVATGCDGLDPIEPPPQGDVELSAVRRAYGDRLVLFGNLEASDLENLPTPQFVHKIRRAIREGTQGQGRGFVLLPSSCPYGRELSPLALANYQAMVSEVSAYDHGSRD